MIEFRCFQDKNLFIELVERRDVNIKYSKNKTLVKCYAKTF